MGKNCLSLSICVLEPGIARIRMKSIPQKLVSVVNLTLNLLCQTHIYKDSSECDHYKSYLLDTSEAISIRVDY